MTGRGKPREAKSPEKKGARSKTTAKGAKQVSREDRSDDKHNGTTKKQELKNSEEKNLTHTKEEPSVCSPPTQPPRKPFTEKSDELQTSATTTKSRVQDTKAKTKSAAQCKEEKKKQSLTPKDNTKAPRTKVQTDRGGTNSPVECVQKTTRTQPQNDTKTTSIKNTKPKTCAGQVKSTVDQAKIKPETPKHITTTRLMQDSCKHDAAVDSILHTTLDRLKIKKNDKASAAEAINEIKRHIIKHLKEKTLCFKDVGEPLGTGSYYEHVKISNPDEFDVMVPILVDRVNIEKFQDDGAFYSVALKRGNSPLQKFQEDDTLSSSKMLEEFRQEVKKCLKPFTEWTVTRKKKGCPAVTLTKNIQSVTISLDVVLCLMVKSSWPPFTNEGLKIESWLGTKVKQEYKRKPYYLVPKYEGKGTVEKDGVLTKDVWRVSFSHVEKAILKNHGSEKTCCERDGERCCRKDCLKLLKHLLSLLKEKDSSLDNFCSYHTKTTLFHACCSRTRDSQWRASSLGQCFKLLLEDFIGYLENGVLNNFFIPSQNLLSGIDQKRCNSLARLIRDEWDKGFPVFYVDCPAK